MHGFERNEAGKIFVGGLSWDTTKDSLLNYFSQYGEVVDCVVMKNPETGKSRGFGFVTYRDPQCLETVLAVPAHIVDGRQVDPKACNPKGPNRGGGGAPGGGPPMGGPGGGPMGGGPGGPDGPRMNRMRPQGGGRMEGIKDRKIFIGGLPSNADEEAIRNFFSKYGKVGEVTVMYDAQKQRSRGFGFMTFESEDAVNQVCREHYINFNGKKVECKRATPRDRGGNPQQQDDGGPPPPHMPPPPQQQMIPGLDLANPHQGPPGPQPPAPGPGVPVQEPSWAPAEGSWGQPPQPGPPPPVGAPGQFPPGMPGFPPGGQYQGGEQGPGGAPGWPQQPPPQAPGGWPPGQQGAPVSTQFVTSQPGGPSYTTSSAPSFQPPPAPGQAQAIYQWATSPPPSAPGQGQQSPPPANGQPPPLSAIAQAPSPPSSSYAQYAAPAYGSPGIATPPNSAASVTQRQYQDQYGNGQVQLTTTVSPVQPPAPPASTQAAYSAYGSPYAAAPPSAGSAPPPAPGDPYSAPPAPGAPPQAAVQVAAPAPAGQPTAVPGAYGSPVAAPPVAGSTTDPAAAKTAVDYSSYYSAYGGVSQYTADSASFPGSGGGTAGSQVTGGVGTGGGFPAPPGSAQVPTATAVTGYGGEAAPATAAAAAGGYGGQPAGAPAPYGGAGDTPPALAYGGGPSPPAGLQRSTPASQSYHPYARR